MTFGSFKAAPRCFIHMPVNLQPDQLIRLTGAAGLELQAANEHLWLTTDNEVRDVFVAPGQRCRIGAHRHALVSADAATNFTVRGQADRTTRIQLVGVDGQREALYPIPPAHRLVRSIGNPMLRPSRVAAPFSGVAEVLFCAALATACSGLAAIAFASTSGNAARVETHRGVVARCDEQARKLTRDHAPGPESRRLRDSAFAACLDHPERPAQALPSVPVRELIVMTK